jgi:hypothetical protein
MTSGGCTASGRRSNHERWRHVYRSAAALSVLMWSAAFPAVLDDGDCPNTGMANPAAFEVAFDRFVAVMARMC